MSAADCDRWIQLADQAAVGEPLTERDKAWLSSHARACGACGAEAQLYLSLRDALGRLEALPMPAHARSAPMAPARRGGAHRRVAVALAMAAGVAVLLGGASYLRRHRAMTRAVPEPPSPTAPITPAPTAHVVLASGQARLDPWPAEAGQQVSQGERLSTESGQACVKMGDSIDVCLDHASAARVTSSEQNRMVVYLEKGTLMARLDHQPRGRTFLVRTSGAEVQAVGTRFSVHVAEDGRTRVRLHEGRVAVRTASHVATELAAPVQASIAQDIRVAPIAAADAVEDGPLIKLVELARNASGTALAVTSTPAGADVFLDNVAMGQTPLSTFLHASAHVRLTLPGHAPVSDWIVCEACGRDPQARIARAFALTPLPPAPAASEAPERPSPPRSSPAHVSPDQLLAKAQALRAQGHDEACAQLYRRLWSEFPSSEAAKVSMVSLGELELVRTRNPTAALRAFDAYLRLGGPLEREARFGKIRALQALDRDKDADAESARFLRDYPTSTQAATLRRRSHAN